MFILICFYNRHFASIFPTKYNRCEFLYFNKLAFLIRERVVCVLVFRKKLFLQIYDNVQNHLLLKNFRLIRNARVVVMNLYIFISQYKLGSVILKLSLSFPSFFLPMRKISCIFPNMTCISIDCGL